jgi:hypothetical protein
MEVKILSETPLRMAGAGGPPRITLIKIASSG